MNNYFINIYDRITGNAWQEKFDTWQNFYKRYCKLVCANNSVFLVNTLHKKVRTNHFAS